MIELLIILIIWYVAYICGRKTGKKQTYKNERIYNKTNKEYKPIPAKAYLFKPNKFLRENGEREFYKALNGKLNDVNKIDSDFHYELFAKVSLSAMFDWKVISDEFRLKNSANTRIASKNFDFVITQNQIPVVAIELDGRSHFDVNYYIEHKGVSLEEAEKMLKETQNKDFFKKTLCEEALVERTYYNDISLNDNLDFLQNPRIKFISLNLYEMELDSFLREIKSYLIELNSTRCKWCGGYMIEKKNISSLDGKLSCENYNSTCFETYITNIDKINLDK